MLASRMLEIKQLLRSRKTVYVNDLCEKYDLSAVTIRKNLSTLEAEGFARKIYGGAVFVEQDAKLDDFHYSSVYAALAEGACDEIEDGDTIFFGVWTGLLCACKAALPL